MLIKIKQLTNFVPSSTFRASCGSATQVYFKLTIPDGLAVRRMSESILSSVSWVLSICEAASVFSATTASTLPHSQSSAPQKLCCNQILTNIFPYFIFKFLRILQQIIIVRTKLGCFPFKTFHNKAKLLFRVQLNYSGNVRYSSIR